MVAAMRGFRFGVQARGPMEAREWREFARRAEGLGYDILSVPDHFDRGPAPIVALASPHSMIGTVDDVVEKLVCRREELGISYIGLSADSMEEMAPVVARISGS